MYVRIYELNLIINVVLDYFIVCFLDDQNNNNKI